MGLFRKESRDIVDFTLLQKRGIIKKEHPQSSSSTVDTPTGFVDLTTSLPQVSASISTPTDFLGFLDSASPKPLTTASNSLENAEIHTIKVKIDDLEFKLERLLEKLSQLETQFSEVK